MLKYQIGTALIASEAQSILYCQDSYFDLEAVIKFGLLHLRDAVSPQEPVVIPTTLM